MQNPIQTFLYHKSSIQFYPERGGIITSLKIQGKELLYQDMLDETLFCTKQSIRGGIPFLFPQAGALTKEEIQQLGYNSPQHGDIRNLPFTHKIYEDKVELVYKNRDSQIPYIFDLKLTYTLSDTTLKITYEVENYSDKDFPIAPGFHPYFSTKNKDTIAWQEPYEKDILLDKENWKSGGTYRFEAPSNSFHFKIAEIGTIGISYDNFIQNFWIWSLPQKDFVCVEPVNGNEGSIIENPIIVKGKSIFKSSIQIELLSL